MWVSQLWEKHVSPKRIHEHRIVHKGIGFAARSPKYKAGSTTCWLWGGRQIASDFHMIKFLACQILPITKLTSLRPTALYISKLQYFYLLNQDINCIFLLRLFLRFNSLVHKKWFSSVSKCLKILVIILLQLLYVLRNYYISRQIAKGTNRISLKMWPKKILSLISKKCKED